MEYLWLPPMALGIVPVLWLVLLRWQGERREAGWWWMAAAFAVSFVADAVTLVAPHRLVAQVYPFAQAGLCLAVLLPRRWVESVIAVLVAAAVTSVMVRQGSGHDVLLRSVAFGLVATVAWRRAAGPLRLALVLAFGGGMLAWWAYVLWPGWGSWGALQGVRIVATGCWCVAAWRAMNDTQPGSTDGLRRA